METITLGSFSIDDDQPVKIQTKEHTIAPPKTKKLKNALIDMHLPDMQITKVKPTISKAKASSNPEDAKQHQDYVIMLSRYGTSPRFSDYLKSLTFKLDIPSLKRLSVRELEDTLQRVRTSIQNRTVSDIWGSTIFGAISTTENVIAMTSLSNHVKLKGLSSALKEDDGFLDLLEEIKLANQNLAYVSTETRLLYNVLTTTMRVHALNSMLDKRITQKATRAEPVAPPLPPVEDLDDDENIIDLSK
jgi:hypothetical protein